MKDKSFIRFLFICILLAFICLGVAFGVQVMFFPGNSFAAIYFLIPFVTAVTLLLHATLVKASSVNPRTFIGKFVAFSGIKLMLYLITILIYAFVVKKEIVLFMIAFLILYFLYTIVEISAILNFLKKISARTDTSNQ